MAEFDRHLDRKKKDERNLQTLNQGFGGLLLGFFGPFNKDRKNICDQSQQQKIASMSAKD